MLDAIGLVIVVSANLLLAAAVLFNNRTSLNRVFAGLATSLSVWDIILYLEDTPFGRANIEVLSKLDYSMSIALAGLYFWFCFEFAHLKRRKVWLLNVFGIGVMICLAIVGKVFRVNFQGQDLVFTPEPAFNLFIAYVAALLLGGVYVLYRHYLTSNGYRRAQLKIINLGFFLAIFLMVVAEVVVPRVFNISSPNVSRAGVYAALFFSSATAYAIIRHRFLDIRTLVARSIAFMIMLIILAVFYAAGLLMISGFIFKTGRTLGIESLLEVGLAVILAFTFQPLRRFVERVTNSIFYRDHYDSQEVIHNFTKILVSELDLDRILKHSLQYLSESLNIQFAQVVVFNNERVYRVAHFGKLPQRLMVAPELAKLNKPMLIADELNGGERKEVLERHSIRVSMTLRTSEDFVGYLLLGDKLSGDIYSSQDIKLLEIIGKELAVTVLNAKAYAQIQEFNLTLQARVDHATNRLRVANRHLKELDHAKDEFISMASHQLRTPLTTIKGYLSMLEEGDAGKLTASQREFVDYAFGASERMVNLISDLLNVSRLSAGRFLIHTKPTDVVQMIDDEVRQLQPHATAKSIALTFEKPPATFPLAEIDDNKTRQVIMNFIDNAIYYTQQGGITVVLEQIGPNMRFEVRDTGIGVPEKAKKKLFSKFYRADNAQTIRPDGTGLGLYLAKRVVEDQGGTIIFSSIEGKGSTFGFELPLKPPPPVKPGKHHARHH